MAKQSGIHQLRGKVGEHSYYRQTGVQSGIVRAINQGMSSKVKTDEAFANTRLNNAEFGQAGRIASVIGRFITPKFRPMILPFSQSIIAKIILEEIKLSSGNWGERNINDPKGEILSEALNKVAKNNFSDYGFTYTLNGSNTQLTLASTSAFIEKMLAIGATGANVKVVSAAPWIGSFVDSNSGYAPSYVRGVDVQSEFLAEGTTSENIPLTWRPAPSEGWPASMSRFVVIIVLPFRDINNTKHILQEHCTFVALPLAEEE